MFIMEWFKRNYPYATIVVSLLYLLWSYAMTPEDPYANVPSFEPITFNNGLECYKSYAFQNELALKFKLRNILELNAILEDQTTPKIFFHKTDCIHDGVIHLSARQACGIESAARMNPTNNIFVVYAAPVGFVNKTKLPLIDAILSYSNVFLTTVDPVTYAIETPLEVWMKDNSILKSDHVNGHVNDYMRAVSLFKYGGTVMDLDVIVKKSLADLDINFAAAGPNDIIYCGILNLGMDETGRNISSSLLREFLNQYDSENFESNGHYHLVRVIQERCGIKETAKMTKEQCKGFTVYPQNKFYAFDFSRWRIAFDTTEKVIKEFLDLIDEQYVVHFSDYLSYEADIEIGKGSGYEALAKLHCPNVYSTIIDKF